MTFSQKVKSEILRSAKGLKGCCAASFLTAVIKSVGSISIDNRNFAFTVESDNRELSEVCQKLCVTQLGVDAQITDARFTSSKQTSYTCRFDASLGGKLHLTAADSDGSFTLCDAASLVPSKPCCARAFMQGLFVACGSVIIPLTDSDIGENRLHSKYHLELRFTDPDFLQAVSAAYAPMELKYTPRKNHGVLYLKDSEKIADYLVYVNAMSAKLQLENVIIGRSVRNRANRQRNCISANIDKSVLASERQTEAIERLKLNGIYEGLPDSLKQIADLRQKYPEATLDEIADMSGISKSGANHRFAKLIELSHK